MSVCCQKVRMILLPPCPCTTSENRRTCALHDPGRNPSGDADGSQRSWVVGNTVQKDSSCYSRRRQTRLFVLLPMLEMCRRKTAKSEGRFLSIDDASYSS